MSGRANPTMTTNRVRGAATSAYPARPVPESRTWPSCSSPRTPESAHQAPPATGCGRRHLRNRTLPGAQDPFPPDRPEHLTPQGRQLTLRRRMSDPALRPPWPTCPRAVLTPDRTVRPRSDRHPAAATVRSEPLGVRQAEAWDATGRTVGCPTRTCHAPVRRARDEPGHWPERDLSRAD